MNRFLPKLKCAPIFLYGSTSGIGTEHPLHISHKGLASSGDAFRLCADLRKNAILTPSSFNKGVAFLISTPYTLLHWRKITNIPVKRKRKMRRFWIIILLWVCQGCLATTPEQRQAALDNQAFAAGVKEAKQAVAEERLGWKLIGRSAPHDYLFRQVLKSDYGVALYFVGDCVVDSQISENARGYNDVMRDAISDRFGEHVIPTAEKKAKDQYWEERHQALQEIVDAQLRQNLKVLHNSDEWAEASAQWRQMQEMALQHEAQMRLHGMLEEERQNQGL